MVVNNNLAADTRDESLLADTGNNLKADTTNQLAADINEPVAQVPEEFRVEETPEDLTADKTPIVEPTPVEEPIVEPEPTPVQEPIVQPQEEVKVKETKIEPTKVEPVQTAQEIKSQELDNQQREEEQKTQMQEKASTEFINAFTSGNMDSAQKIALDNPEMKDQFASSLRQHFKNESNVKFFRKYSGATNQEMQSAIDSGDMVVGSSEYNLLPEEQRKRYEAFSKLNLSKKSDFKNDNNNVISLDSLEKQRQAAYSFDLRAEMEKKKNSPELTETRKGLEALQNKINAVDDELESLEDDVRAEFPNLPASAQNSIINQRSKNALRKKNTLTNEYRAKLGTYQDMKADLEMDFQIALFEDQQAKAKYQSDLNIYTFQQEQLNDQQIAAFEAQTKERAEALKFERDLFLKEFEANLEQSQKGGTYKVDRQGRQVYIKNGVSTFVRDVEGEVLFTESNKNYTDTTTKEDGVLITTRSYNDGRAPEYFSYDINGNRADGGNNTVDNLLSNISSDDLWCGQAVNKYVVGQLGIPREEFWMGDSYASKKKFINDTEPMIGGIAIWNDENIAGGKFQEFGHTGIVTGYNPANRTVQITDWNWNGDKKKSTHTVKISDIVGSDGGFFNPNSTPKAAAFDSQDVPLYKKFLGEKGLTSTEINSIKDFDEFKIKAELYQDELNKQGTPQIEKLIKLALDLKNNRPGRKARIAADFTAGQFISKELADYKAQFDALISNKALDNLVSLKANGATFGALSEKELQFIQDSATLLKGSLSDDKFDEELDNIVNNLKLGLSDERFEEITSGLIRPTNEVGVNGTGFASYQQRATTQGYNYKTYR